MSIRAASSRQTLGCREEAGTLGTSIPGQFPERGEAAGLGVMQVQAAAAVPSAGIPHSCFLLPYLTGASAEPGAAATSSASCTSHHLPPRLDGAHPFPSPPLTQQQPL